MSLDTLPTKIAQNLNHIHAQIQQVAFAPNKITLVAVSKTFPVADILLAYQAGQRFFAENYVQESLPKIAYLTTQIPHQDPIIWHFIGPIQRNKTQDIATHFDWVQSIDRYLIAQRLSEQRPPTALPLQVLLQVNISGEISKAGVHPNDVLPLAAKVQALKNIVLRGLMAIPMPMNNTTENVSTSLSEQFKAMQVLFAKLQQLYPQVDTLSMGMSQDYQLAIAQGSTMIRMGTAIFGARERFAV